jgi:hypothetical protein
VRRFLVITTLLLSGWGLLPAAVGGTVAGPGSPDGRADVRVVGEALETALPRLGKAYGVELRAGRELAGQRVTLYGKQAPLQLWTKGLEDLLSVKPDATVFWARGKEGTSRQLAESKNRRDLAARLRNVDQEQYWQYLEQQLAWARGEGRQELERAGLGRRAVVQQVMDLTVVNAHGEEGRRRLLAGEPLVVSFSQFLDGPQEPLFREYLAGRFPDIAPLNATELRGHSFVFMRERHPSFPPGGGLTMSLVLPSGFQPMHGSILRASGQPGGAGPVLGLAERPQPGQPGDRRVSLCLTPVPGAKPGETVERNLDQLLEVVAGELGLNVIADGYLRSSLSLPVNFQVKDYPLEQLLTRIAAPWICEWRYLGADRKTVLVRAKHWWLEDAADVPQAQVEDLRARLGDGKPPALEDLLRLAELSEPQIRKLLQTGACRSAEGILPGGLCDGIGVRPCLRFFSRLPRALQERAQSPEGLPLSAADPALVQAWLYPTLVAYAGAVTPERRQELVFSLTPLPAPGAGGRSPGFRLNIRSPRRGGCNWFRYVQPPQRPIAVERH